MQILNITIEASTNIRFHVVANLKLLTSYKSKAGTDDDNVDEAEDDTEDDSDEEF